MGSSMERQHRPSVLDYTREFLLKRIGEIYQPTIIDPQNNLSTIRAMSTYMKFDPETGVEKPWYNMITAFNHVVDDDPILALWLNWTYIDPAFQRPMLLPASHYHTNFFREPRTTIAYSLSGEIFNYERVRIIQVQQVDDPDFHYTKAQARRTYESLILKMEQMRQKGPFSFVIAPEGHRSKQENSSLQEAQRGIGYFVQNMTPCVIVPVGITYEKPFRLDHLNFDAKPQLRIAKPFVQEGIMKPGEKREFITDLMVRIGSVLPEKMRGYYAPQIKESMTNAYGALSAASTVPPTNRPGRILDR